MRIVAGKNRSRKIVFPNIPSKVRPTMDKVREAIFSSIGFDVNGAVVLDLFAGSGAYGLEALSRGAKFAYFNDSFKPSLDCIKTNIAALKETNVQVTNLDYKICLENLKNEGVIFDIVFLDPPYKMEVYEEIVNYLLENKMVSENPIFVLETDKEHDFSYLNNYKEKKYNYSDTIVYILRG